MNTNRKILARPKKHQNIVARPILACPLLQKKKFLACPLASPYKRPPVKNRNICQKCMNQEAYIRTGDTFLSPVVKFLKIGLIFFEKSLEKYY